MREREGKGRDGSVANCESVNGTQDAGKSEGKTSIVACPCRQTSMDLYTFPEYLRVRG